MTNRITLDKLRKSEAQAGSPGSGIWSPFSMPVKSSASLRFVPGLFGVHYRYWVEQRYYRWKFIEEESGETIYASIPCRETYTALESQTFVHCPIAKQLRDLFSEAKSLKEAGASDEGKQLHEIATELWFEKRFLYQGFISGQSGIDPNVLMPIRLFKSLHEIIYQSVLGDTPTLDTLPTGNFTVDDCKAWVEDYVPDGMSEDEFVALFMGRDFICRKEFKNEMNSYSSSMWAVNETMLDDERIAYIAENGFIDLTKFLPPRPSDELYNTVFMDMFETAYALAAGEGEGIWNPEWENQEYGVTVFRPNKGKNEETEGNGSGSRSSLRRKLVGRKEDSEDEAEAAPVKRPARNLRERIVAKTEEPEDEPVNETEDESVAEAAPRPRPRPRVSARQKADDGDSESTTSKINAIRERVKRSKTTA